jgi:hypothetical protein
VDGGDRAEKVVSTDQHPFWVESLNRWVEAKDLKPGYRLETADHRDATVTETRTWSDVQRVYNLTVDGLHTYFVVGGGVSLLVHNQSSQPPRQVCETLRNYGEVVWERDWPGKRKTLAVLRTPSGGFIRGHSGPGRDIKEFEPWLRYVLKDHPREPGFPNRLDRVCAELDCLQKAMRGTGDIRGGYIESMLSRSSVSRNHELWIPPCDRCITTLRRMEVEW